MSPQLLRRLRELKLWLQAGGFPYDGANLQECWWLDELGHDFHS